MAPSHFYKKALIDKGSQYGWMIHIARNTALNWVKTKRPQAFQSLSADGLGSNDFIEFIIAKGHYCVQPNSECIGLNGLFEQLLPENRKIINLLYFEDCTYRVAANKLSVLLSSIVHKHRAALQELKEVYLWSNPIVQW